MADQRSSTESEFNVAAIWILEEEISWIRNSRSLISAYRGFRITPFIPINVKRKVIKQELHVLRGRYSKLADEILCLIDCLIDSLDDEL